jgi:hypothetical protein
MAPSDYLVQSDQCPPSNLMNRSQYRMGWLGQTVMLDQTATLDQTVMLAQEEIALHFLH